MILRQPVATPAASAATATGLRWLWLSALNKVIVNVQYVLTIRRDALALLAEQGIEPAYVSTLALGINGAPVVWIDGRMEAISTVKLEPVVVENTVVVTTIGWSTPVAIVLQSAIHVVRIARVGCNGIELTKVHIVEHDEAVALVIGYVRSLIIADVEDVGIKGIEPKGMEIAGNSAHASTECAPAIM